MAYMQLYKQQGAVQAAAQQVFPPYLPSQHFAPQATSGASPYQVAAQQHQSPSMAVPYTVSSQASLPRPTQYTTGPSGIPTNVKHGTVRTEFRGVFISNLSYDTQDMDIQRHFCNCGEIVKLDHKKEQKSNSKRETSSRSKGSAVITFASCEQAAKAVQKLNGCYLNERKLTVRLDTEPTPVDPPLPRYTSTARSRKSKKTNCDGSPLIVDGSKYDRNSEI